MQNKEKEMIPALWMALTFFGLAGLFNLITLTRHLRESNVAIKLQMEINNFLRERIEALEKEIR